MIKVTVKYDKDMISEIELKGHALYDDYGKDIVCASVSTCLITTVNAISELDNEYLDVLQSDSKVTIKVRKDNDTCYKVLNNMMNILEELSSQYKENVRIYK